MTTRIALMTAALCVSACSFQPEKIFSDYTRIEVLEVGRSLHCNAGSDQPSAALFADAAALRGWLEQRGVALPGVAALADAPHSVIELGRRPTGGYGLAVSRAAVLRGELLILTATFVSPGPGSMVTQALTSPCVVVQLPAGRYSAVEVQDPAGAVRAAGAVAGPAASAESE